MQVFITLGLLLIREPQSRRSAARKHRENRSFGAVVLYGRPPAGSRLSHAYRSTPPESVMFHCARLPSQGVPHQDPPGLRWRLAKLADFRDCTVRPPMQ